jgi:hypothetical protein
MFLNIKRIDTAASTERSGKYGKYMKYISFPWPSVAAAHFRKMLALRIHSSEIYWSYENCH